MATVRFIAIGYSAEGAQYMARPVTYLQMCSIHAAFICRGACHLSPQLWGGMTFFRPLDARAVRRNSSIDVMESCHERVDVQLDGVTDPDGAGDRELERVDACQSTTDGQLVNGLRTLVRNDALEIEHVPDGHILGTDPRPTQHIAGVARDIQGHAAVVPLGQGHLRRGH